MDQSESHKDNARLIVTSHDIVQFFKFVEILPNGCWFWTGARSRGKGNRKWYPSFWIPSLKITVRGHRFSSEVFNCEECPPGYHRDHTCNFSMRVCPDCIEVVTKEENQRRKMERKKDLEQTVREAMLRRQLKLELTK